MIYSPSNGVITTRPPFRCYTATPLPGAINNLHPYKDYLMCSCANGKLYALDLAPASGTFGTFVELSSLSSTASFLNFNDKLLFADGSGLYSWDGNTVTATVTTILDSGTTPAMQPNVISEVANRVVINDYDDPDAIYLSGPEDETDWDTAANAVGLRAGYGDDMAVNGIAVLGQDVIVSKVGKGRRFLYRVNVSGPSTGWSVQNLIADSSATGPLLITPIPNNVMYINEDSELRGVAGIQEYGDLKMINAGEKINPGLVQLDRDGYSPSMLRYLPSYDILACICSGRIYAFHHSTGRFTYFDGLSSGINIVSGCDYNNDPVWGGSNGHIYEWVDSGLPDSPTRTTTKDYESRVRSKTYTMPGEMLLKKSYLNVVHVAEGSGRLEVSETIIKKFSLDAPGWYLFDADMDLYDATMDLYTADINSQTLSIRNRVRKKDFYFELITNSGRVGLNYVNANLSMVNG